MIIGLIRIKKQIKYHHNHLEAFSLLFVGDRKSILQVGQAPQKEWPRFSDWHAKLTSRWYKLVPIPWGLKRQEAGDIQTLDPGLWYFIPDLDKEELLYIYQTWPKTGSGHAYPNFSCLDVLDFLWIGSGSFWASESPANMGYCLLHKLKYRIGFNGWGMKN